MGCAAAPRVGRHCSLALAVTEGDLACTLIPLCQSLCATFGNTILLALGAIVAIFGHTILLIQRALCAVFGKRIEGLAQGARCRLH